MRPLDEILEARFERPDPADWMAKYRELVPTKPRFDTIAVQAMSAFDSVPRRKPSLVPEPLHAIFGFPVVIDETVERGFLELRLGDEVVEKVRIA